MLMQVPNTGLLAARNRRRDSAGRSRLRLSVALSLSLHGALLAAFVPLFYRTPRPAEAPDTSGAVELVMVEQKGKGATVVRPEPSPPVAVPEPSPPPTPPVPPPPDAATAEEALPLPTPPIPPSASPPQPQPPAQQAQEVPEINLGGNDSETNAIASGPDIIPASVDAKFRNREPVYPPDAVRRAEQGAVILLIHVSPEGLPDDADIEQSSGFMSLDSAARNAVMGWHFLPAVRDGQPIPFTMQLRVVFHLE